MARKDRVLFVADSPQDRPTGGGRTRIVSELKTLRSRGYDPSLLCFVAADKVAKHGTRLLAARKALEDESNCNVSYVPQMPLTRLGPISAANVALKSRVICRVASKRGTQIVHTHSISAGLAAVTGARAKPKFKVVADLHGIEPEEYALAKGLGREDRTAAHLARREYALLKAADGLIVVSESMRRHFEAKYRFKAQKIIVIPCCTEIASDTSSPDTRHQVRADLAVSGRPVVAYLGSAESYQLPGEICALFEGLKDHIPEAFFLVLSHDGRDFRSRLESMGFDSPRDFRVLALNHAEIPRLLAAADIGFLLRRDTQVNRVAFPTKFGEYCAAGVPVLTTPFVGDVTRHVEQEGIGLVLDPDDPKGAAKLSSYLSHVMKSRARFASQCRTFASKSLNWKSAGDALDQLYRGLLTSTVESS